MTPDNQNRDHDPRHLSVGFEVAHGPFRSGIRKNSAGWPTRNRRNSCEFRYGYSKCATSKTAVGGPRSARTVCVSPFPEDKGRVLHFGGFDAAQGPHRDTAWIYKGILKEKQ
jgi:hypothetical protein